MTSTEPVTSTTGIGGRRAWHSRHEHVAPLVVQVDVEHDDVDVFLRSSSARAVASELSLEHLVPVELEIDPAKQPNRRLVVDDEDAGRRMTPGIPHLARVYGLGGSVPTAPERSFTTLKWQRTSRSPERGGRRGVQSADPAGLPHPTQRFRRRAWLAFQRALDPLAPPKPLPTSALTPRRRPPPAGG